MSYDCRCGRPGWIKINDRYICKECHIEIRQRREEIIKERMMLKMDKKEFKEKY